jgi:hypothetical protein
VRSSLTPRSPAEHCERRGSVAVKLSPREQALVNKVLQKIKGFDPQAIVKVADDTIEHEGVLILVYTDKSSLEIIQHIVPCTGDILADEDFDILVVVVPEDRHRARTGGSKSVKRYRAVLIDAHRL